MVVLPAAAKLRASKQEQWLQVPDHLRPKVTGVEFGTFCFAEEFPDYRYLRRLTGTSKVRLGSEVFDEYLADCEARLRRGDMAAATVRSYRQILDGVWRPRIGDLVFSHVSYSRLVPLQTPGSGAKGLITMSSALSDVLLILDIVLPTPGKPGSKSPLCASIQA